MAKIERTKNATRNIFFGMILKVYQIIAPFLMRTAMIYFMGVQYLGLNSLFSSVLQVLNLAELGVGSAMVYSMYKPIADDDTVKICALMRLYKIYYRIIGIVIATLGLALLPLVPKLIKGDIPGGLNIYILYLLNLSATVLSYWLFAYKNSILLAHQRTDIISKVTIITSTIQYASQLFVLWYLKNYYIYILVVLFTQVLTNILTAFVSDYYYPFYKAKGDLSLGEIKKINRRIKDLFTSKIGFVIVGSADTIVISAFLGLTVLAIYQNYYFILTSIIGIVTVIFSSCTAGIGNSLITESEEKNFNDLNEFTFLISWIASICSCCFLGIYQPFMILWVGKEYLLPFNAVICLVAYYFVYEINQLLNLYKDAGGIWHEDRFRPLVTAVSNLVMNIILVNYFGIYGVILSTVLSTLFVGMPWLFHNLFSTIFAREHFKVYLKKLLRYIAAVIVSCAAVVVICNYIDSGIIVTIILRLVVCVMVPFVLFIVAFGKTIEFKRSVLRVDGITKGKLKLKSFIA